MKAAKPKYKVKLAPIPCEVPGHHKNKFASRESLSLRVVAHARMTG